MSIEQKQKLTFPEKLSGNPEFSAIQKITDEQLLDIIWCSGVNSRFNKDSLFMSEEGYQPELNPKTNAYELIQRGMISDHSGKNYHIRFNRDRDNLGITIFDPIDSSILIGVNLRDREHDATIFATSPYYLTTIGKLRIDQIPLENNYIGGTNWYYSSTQDLELEKRHSVEISIVSSDPNLKIKTRLTTKEGKFWNITADELADFIDDPFATLEKLSLDKWYKMWWQVVNRGLRGKIIPLPGQTSEKGFSGYFNHVIETSINYLKTIDGITHLSSVPTWAYVWRMFLDRGFKPDHMDIHEIALDFFDRIEKIEMGDSLRREQLPVTLQNFNKKDPLYSWTQVLAYAIAKDTTFIPTLDIPNEYQTTFFQILDSAKKNLIGENGEVMVYPLSPGANLWHSREL